MLKEGEEESVLRGKAASRERGREEGREGGLTYLGGSHGDMLKEGEEEGVLPRQSSVGTAEVINQVQLARVRTTQALDDVLILVLREGGKEEGREGGREGL